MNSAVTLTHQRYPEIDCDILYFEHMVSEEKLEREVVLPLTRVNPEEINGLFRRKSFEQINDLELVIEEILSGKTAIFF
ncbi:MAG: hypothetical protein LRY73_05690 [Bacillus sp. (in: Bacteria)]|nr:hypothetical protein [Bacillus sp. (in: firmicutes)]